MNERITLRLLLAGVAALASLLLLGACAPCSQQASPCPKAFDLGRWCASGNQCTLDGKPAECQGFSGCRIERGKKLQIPLQGLDSLLEAHDLRVEKSGGQGMGPLEGAIAVSIDGIAATPSAHAASGTYFLWSSTSAPNMLEAFYDGPMTDAAFSIELSFVDATCEMANPPEFCGE